MVSAATRPPTAIASRLLFTSLTVSLLVVLRLLQDLAEPFHQGGYTLSVKNAAGAVLVPARRKLVASLTRAPRASSVSRHAPSAHSSTSAMLNPALRK